LICDETLLNFIKTKHPMEGEKKEQNERTHVQARKLGGLIRGVGKSQIFNPLPPLPLVTRSMS
jgi:hypothetical protein